MKDLKLINKEINEIMSSIKDENSDSFSIIRKSKDALLEYYSKNKDEIEKDALLKKYKALTYDDKSMISYLLSLIIGMLASILSTVLLDIEKSESLSSIIVNIVMFAIASLLSVFAIMKMHNHFHKKNNLYIDNFHAKIIEKILMENGIYVNDDIENIDLDIYKNDSVSKE